MKDIIIIIISLAIIAMASYYVYKSKKSGKKCIGCPHSGNCTYNCETKKGC